MIHITQKYDCCGCFACTNICPKKCITMYEDNEGFLYPQVNEKVCIQCGACQNVCPMKRNPLKKDSPYVYACKNKDEKIRLESSSGGIFNVLAEYVIERGGVVFGAMFNEKFNVIHHYAESKDDLIKFRGSKYVQSSIGLTYKKAKMFLKQGRMVLFSGTPCQIAGLIAFLNEENDNLLTIDIVCHGVPSPKVFLKYIKQLECKYKAEIQNISFRNKRLGWKTFSFFMGFKKNAYFETMLNDIYMQGFLKNLFLRPSCYMCKFCAIKSNADISLADYWGIHTKFPEFDDDKGVSLVLVNTQKGKIIFESLASNIDIISSDLEHAIRYNTSIIKPVVSHPKRKYFFKHIDNKDICELIQKCLKENKIKIIRIKLLNIIKKMIHKIKYRNQ